MKKILAKGAMELLSWCIGLIAHIVLFSGGSSKVRAKLGKIYSLLRRSDHENYMESLYKQYDIHPTVILGYDTLVYGEGSISIGEGTYLGRYCFVVGHPGDARIRIGKHCAISHDVHIRTASYETEVHFQEAMDRSVKWGDVIVGDYVWIGANVFITGGVTIGDNSVIGANAVVTHDVPANAIYAGVPARCVRYKPGFPKSTGACEAMER